MKLREIRQARNLTQEQLCDAAGYRRGWVSSLEQAYRPPTVRSLKSYARGLGMKLTITFTAKDGKEYEYKP